VRKLVVSSVAALLLIGCTPEQRWRGVPGLTRKGTAEWLTFNAVTDAEYVRTSELLRKHDVRWSSFCKRNYCRIFVVRADLARARAILGSDEVVGYKARLYDGRPLESYELVEAGPFGVSAQ